MYLHAVFHVIHVFIVCLFGSSAHFTAAPIRGWQYKMNFPCLVVRMCIGFWPL